MKVKIGNVEGLKGSNVEVPIYLEDVPDVGIYVCSFYVAFDETKLQVMDVKKGELIQNASDFFTNYNTVHQSGFASMVFMGPSDNTRRISKDGIIGTIVFKILDDAKISDVYVLKHDLDKTSVYVDGIQDITNIIYSNGSVKVVDKLTPTPTATAVVTPTPTATAVVTPTPTATAKVTPTPTATAAVTPTPTATAVVTPTPTATAEVTPIPTATAEVTPTPTATAEVTPTPTATAEVTPTPTATAAITPTVTVKPTATNGNGGGGGGGGGGNNPPATSTPTPIATSTPTPTMIVEPTPEVPGPVGPQSHTAYVKGYPDGLFLPDNNITRAEAATILAKLSGADVTYVNNSISFPDVKDTHWALWAIKYATDKGYFIGYTDGTFRPDQKITRAEFATIVYHFLGIEDKNITKYKFDDVKGHWAQVYIEKLSELNYISGYPNGTFKPQSNIKRSESVALLNRALKRGPLYGTTQKFPDVPETHWAFRDIAEGALDHQYIMDGTIERLFVK